MRNWAHDSKAVPRLLKDNLLRALEQQEMLYEYTYLTAIRGFEGADGCPYISRSYGSTLGLTKSGHLRFNAGNARHRMEGLRAEVGGPREDAPAL